MRHTRHRYGYSHGPPDGSTTKVPPYWEPGLEQEYPFRIWLQDLELWVYSTEVATERKGPSIALRLGGTAKALVREIPPATLAHGANRAVDPPQYNGQGDPVMEHRSGVQVIIDMLRRRFHPFEQESQIRVLNEFFQFRRDHHEDVDSVMSRFELVLYRAGQVAQFTMPEVGRAYMILHHLRIPLEKWPLLLAETRGNLPSSEAEYNAFCEYVRRNTHLWEGVGEKSLRPQHHSSATTGYYNEDYPEDEGAIVPLYAVTAEESHYEEAYHAGDYDASEYDGMTAWDELDFVSSSTLEDDEDRSYENMDVEELYSAGDHCMDLTAAFHAAQSEEDWKELGLAFMANFRRARARVKRFFGKRPKRWVKRRFGKGGKRSRKGKGGGKFRGFLADSTEHYYKKSKGKGKNISHEDSYFELTASSYLGKNPSGADGRTMECHECGSTDHLVAQCPKRRAKGGGKGGKKGKFYTEQYYAPDTFASSELADDYYEEDLIPQNAVVRGNQQLDFGVTLKPVHSAPPSLFPVATPMWQTDGLRDPHELSFKNRRAMFESSFSAGSEQQAYGELVSQSARSVPGHSTTLDALPASSSSSLPRTSEHELSSVLSLAVQPSRPMRQDLWYTECFEEHSNRDRPEPERQDMLTENFWPVFQASRNIDAANLEVQYHMRSRLTTRGREGLLVDPGAIMNLCGEKWLMRQTELAKATGRHTQIRSAARPMSVEGVGKGAQQCNGEAQVPICLHSATGPRPDLYYEAQFIEDSEIPALLGLDTLKRRRCLLDCYNGILFEIGPGAYNLQVPKGTNRYQLESGESGHWLLPCSDWPEKKRQKSSL